MTIAKTTVIAPREILHFSWEFLTSQEKSLLCSLHPATRSYSRLRLVASSAAIHHLLEPRPAPAPDEPTDKTRVARMAAALLRFNFNYGNLIRWLKGPYTYNHRDWTALQDCIKIVENVPPPPGWPKVNLPRAMKVLQQGCPLAGHYHCSFDSVLQRNLHPPSKDLQKEAKSVDKCLRKEEKLSYHILLPRFLFRFLFLLGLHLALFRILVAYKNDDPDPRLCVDPTSTVSKMDNGNVNAQITDPGAPGRHDENPPIYYGAAFMRQLVWLGSGINWGGIRACGLVGGASRCSKVIAGVFRRMFTATRSKAPN